MNMTDTEALHLKYRSGMVNSKSFVSRFLSFWKLKRRLGLQLIFGVCSDLSDVQHKLTLNCLL